jgi:2-dehydro-3-deoxyphosphogluconate aldolase / (4S)-4-hydroxy-2-oxoglutarate aldolase
MNAQQSSMTAALRRSRIMPVIVIDDPNDAGELATALLAGGLPIAEITLRTPRALDALRRITQEQPDMFAGAGTVLNVSQAAQAKDAGAKFIVSPGFSRAVVDYCLEHDLAVYPGVSTASEIQAALDAGLNLLKLWPIETLGGPAYLKLLAGPFGGVEFNANGGLTAENFEKYLSLPNVVACGGPWMAPREWIAARQFDRIRDATRDTVSRVARVAAPARESSLAATAASPS